MVAKQTLNRPEARFRSRAAGVGWLAVALILCAWIDTALAGKGGPGSEPESAFGWMPVSASEPVIPLPGSGAWSGVASATNVETPAERGRADREWAHRERADEEERADPERVDQGERADRERADRERAAQERAAQERAAQEWAAQERAGRDTTVFLYGARWTDNRWVDILRGQTEFDDSYLGAVGVAQTLRRFSEDLLLEAEVSLVRHWGEQDHFELNGALNLRWSRFPWDRWVDTSFAYGLGPSYAFTEPAVEARPDRPASRGLVFMVTELTFAPPQADGRWAGLLRIHHRSGAFDLVSEASGSNFIATGIRYHY